MKLSSSLCIYVLCICVCIFAAISIVLEKYASTRESEQAHRLTELLQGEMIRGVEDDLYSVTQNTDRTVREITAMPTPLTETQAVKILGIMVESDPVITGASLAYVPGFVPGHAEEWMVYVHRTPSGLSSRQLGGTAYDYTTKDWFTAPLTSGDSRWSPPYIDRGGADCLMTTYSVPLKDSDGNVYAIATADVALQSLEEEIAQLRPYPASRSFLLSSDGTNLSASQPDNKVPIALVDKISGQLNTAGHIDGELTSDGEEYIVCCSRITGTDLIIATATPYQSALAVIKHLKLPLLLIIGCGFILLLIGIRFVILYATRPLNRISEAAIRIGNGDFSTALPDVGPYSDLRNLRDAMASMTESIQRYIATIEQNTRNITRIESELDIARRIQQGMLPTPWPDNGYEIGDAKVRIDALLQPAREVSGDMYDYVCTEEMLYFIVADVSDKGVPASLVMSGVHSLFRFAAEQMMEPKEILQCINRHICESNPQNMFVTAITGVIDIRKKLMTVANAGHNPPLLITGERCRYLTLAPGLPIGVTEEVTYTQTSLQFGRGESIMLYTDGVTEAEDSNHIPFGEGKLQSTVSSLLTNDSGIKPRHIVRAVSDAVSAYSIVPPFDDITIMCIGINSSILLDYDIKEIERLATFVAHTASQAGWSPELTQRINLILEEAVSNIINYSRPDADRTPIEVTISTHDDDICMDITDSGNPFNPLESVPDVDITLPVEERPIGGLGLYLIRRLASSADYEYKDSKNHLRLFLNKT